MVMSRWLGQFTVCMVLFSAHAGAINTQDAQKPVLTIAADEWCPINCDPSSRQPGIGIDLVKKIFEPLGYGINYIVQPWTQALADSRAGRIDMVVGANTVDDPSLIFPRHYLYNMSDDFYVLKGNPWRYQGPYTLRGKRIGVIEGYGYGEVVQKFITDNKNVIGIVQLVGGDNAVTENINKLMGGKIDVVVESKPVMSYTLQRLHMEDKVEWAGSVASAPVFVAFSPAKPNSRALAAQYDAGIARLKATGELDKIYGAYNLQP